MRRTTSGGRGELLAGSSAGLSTAVAGVFGDFIGGGRVYSAETVAVAFSTVAVVVVTSMSPQAVLAKRCI